MDRCSTSSWKLYFPHSYRSLNSREGGKGGQPAPYEQLSIATIELYDLSTDPSETQNVADQNPEVVQKIEMLADTIRSRLGDALYNQKGLENREPAIILP